jgi:hypothetical protein
MHEMEVNWTMRQKVEGWNVNFHKWKGIWINKRFLICSHFKEKYTKEQTIAIKDKEKKVFKN